MESVSTPDKVKTPTEYVSMSGEAFNMIFPNDTDHFKSLDTIIEWEPIDTIGPEVRYDICGEIGTIDIANGKAFRSDERMKMPPTAADDLGDASARTIALKTSRRSP